ncbi:MAG: octaprenyl-diphosphate synthase [bacterium]
MNFNGYFIKVFFLIQYDYLKQYLNLAIYRMNAPQEIPSIKEILAPVQPYLDIVEQMVVSNLDSDIPLLKEIGEYILKSGGKRLRPALLLLASGSLGTIGDKACRAATALEYIHTATLLHDDVVDNADIRRNKKAARSIWGNEAAVLVGDYLYTVSFKHMSEFDNIQVIKDLSRATTMMAQGEILQLTRTYLSTSIEDYLKIVLYKTASLMGTAMSIGGILAGASQEQVEALIQCGENLGIAFQMVDDTLDYLDTNATGKEIGVDLKERKITLPLSHLLENAKPVDKAKVLEILEQKEITDEHVEFVSKLMQDYKSLPYTLEVAQTYVNKALEYLEILPDSQYRESIKQVAQYILYRNK